MVVFLLLKLLILRRNFSGLKFKRTSFANGVRNQLGGLKVRS